MELTKERIEEAFDQKLIDARKENLRRLADIEHRLEYVDCFNGIEYINDAKASDINSSWYSLDNISNPIVWIMSSCMHESDYDLLDEIDVNVLRGVVVVGSNQAAILEVFQSKLENIGMANSIHHAVELANEWAETGDSVLYSPAFSDLENYVHFKERGQQFRKAVRELQLGE